ncbi:MAG: AMP-binding protein, partial [Chamaesiphon sp.]|nr:AMP-binding protein [Chamaesiphon sp.]
MKNSIEDRHSSVETVFCPFTKKDIEQSISSCFERQVRQHPHRLAIKTYEHQLTYESLNQAANRLAHSILAQCGEGHEPIPILFEHGAMMLVAMLGVLKAGKSWVPIDPTYPLARISHLLETFQSAVVVTNRRNSIL